MTGLFLMPVTRLYYTRDSQGVSLESMEPVR